MTEEDMLDKKVWAVIGANENKEKYGYKIYKTLKSQGYTVYPVNPNYEKIEGDKCYPDLSSLPEKPEVLDMVVSPKRGIDVLKEADKLGIRNIWLQPGTYNDQLMEFIREKGLNAVKACILISLS